MTCNICSREIAHGAPMVMVYVEVNIPARPSRYTGIAWHPECAPEHREQIADDVDALARRSALAPDGRGEETR